MLENVETMFDGMSDMMARLKKPSYEKNMKIFREKNGHYFDEMTAYTQEKSDKDEKSSAAREIAGILNSAAKERFTQKGKIKRYAQLDNNLFMIYYVFPAILLTGHEDAKIIADAICDDWGKRFEDGRVSYADYDTIYNGFNDKIFGIF